MAWQTSDGTQPRAYLLHVRRVNDRWTATLHWRSSAYHEGTRVARTVGFGLTRAEAAEAWAVAWTNRWDTAGDPGVRP